jgi:hypothetical protein
MSKKQVKKITIEMKENKDGQEMSFTTTGFTSFEVLGILRLYEQQTSIEILQRMGNVNNTEKQTEKL